MVSKRGGVSEMPLMSTQMKLIRCKSVGGTLTNIALFSPLFTSSPVPPTPSNSP